MAKKHACETYKHFLHGADYNPEQWDSAVWDEDMRLMKLAHCNEMTVGIFSWSTLEPREGEYDFSFLDTVIDKVWKNGGRVILATPSGARPRWMAEKYPEVLRVGPDGQREHFRARHNHCFTSPVYRQKVSQMNRALAQRYGKHPAVVAWHLSNEYGGECHCPLCVDAFREYLRKKFDGDISKLNKAYWTTFWSHTYDRFDQIEPPSPRTDTGIHGLNLDWMRFVTEQTASFIENEAAPIREYSPHLPITINMMYEHYGLDYHRLAQVIDIASWDSYPEWHNGDDTVIAQRAAFWHDLYRSLKQRPFLLMESTPSLVNWKPYNKPKKPGMDVLSALQAVAHGSDSVQYFQWRKSRGSSEKLHGAVVGHDGTEHTRVFQAVAKTGRLLEQLDEICGTVTKAKVAIIYDWENMWALDDSQAYAQNNKKYLETCYAYHRIFWERGIDCDIISRHAELSGYSLVIVPMLYLTDRQTEESFCRYVEQGGTLYATYMLGTVDENDLCHLGGIPGGALKALFGIEASEIDTLYPEERQHAWAAGQSCTLEDYCEVVALQGARAIAEYADGWYKGLPAATEHAYGKGYAIYQACRDEGLLKRLLLEPILERLQLGPAVQLPEPLPQGITLHSRTDGENTYQFVLNWSGTESKQLRLSAPLQDLCTGMTSDIFELKPYGYAVLQVNA